MIILSILLMVLLIGAAAAIVRLVFKPKWAWLNRVMVVMIALAIVFGAITVIADGICSARVENLRAEAEDINLYYNTILYTDNEYVRFDFYQRVQDYNIKYAQMQEDAQSLWIGAFFPKDWETYIVPIDFALNSGING